MANIAETGRKGKKLSPRVDLTPMVDLAFLLITFFIFTTNLSTPTVMNTYLPADSSDSSQIAASGAVTLIAGQNAMLYYAGLDANPDTLLYSKPDVLRTKLIQLRNTLIKEHGNDNKLFVTIKPTSQAQLQHIVQLFDEMSICTVRSYALVDIPAQELPAYSSL